MPLVNQRWLFLPNSLYWHYFVLFPPTNAKVEVEVEVEVEEEVFIHSFTMYLSTRFYENEPNEICSYLSEKASKGRFLLPISSKITPVKRKKGEKQRPRNTLLDWRKRSISKLRLDIYVFLSLVRPTRWFWLYLRRYLFQRDHLSMVA